MNTPNQTPAEQAAAALETLIALHCDWTTGSAYVRAAFVEQNNAAIANARAALAALRT